jgi:hypothetical protein
VTAKLYSPEKLLLELGISAPDEIDIEAIAEFCQATVIPQKLRGSAARIIGIGDRAFITVDSKSHRARQRFSAAHELGHWMLDRGKLASFVCSEKNFVNDWTGDNPERRANRYAADLLLPKFMFEPLAKNKDITFQTVRELCSLFQTSITATAIRLVELGSFPSIIVCNSREGRRWQFRGVDVPYVIQLRDFPSEYTNAFDLLHGKISTANPETVQASDWVTHTRSRYYSLHEDSVRITEDLVLSILWWKDERQLLDLEEGEEQ